MSNYRQDHQRGGSRKKRTGAKFITYKNSNGESKEMITAWNASKKGMLMLKAYPMTEKGARARAKALNLDSSYSSETSNGNERFYYEARFKAHDDYAIKTYRGVAIFVRTKKKLYVPRFDFVASCNAPNGGYFGSSSKPKR